MMDELVRLRNYAREHGLVVEDASDSGAKTRRFLLILSHRFAYPEEKIPARARIRADTEKGAMRAIFLFADHKPTHDDSLTGSEYEAEFRPAVQRLMCPRCGNEREEADTEL